MKAPPKRRGELAELRFMAKAASLGFAVSKPFGDSTKYDFIVDAEGRLSRVQIKSAWVGSRSGYQIGAGLGAEQVPGHRRPYRSDEIDFLVAYLGPEDIWFVIPVEEILSKNWLQVRTDPEHPLAQYREAWGLMLQSVKRRAASVGVCGESPAQRPA